jgi:hypothetical protein
MVPAILDVAPGSLNGALLVSATRANRAGAGLIDGARPPGELILLRHKRVDGVTGRPQD